MSDHVVSFWTKFRRGNYAITVSAYLWFFDRYEYNIKPRLNDEL